MTEPARRGGPMDDPVSDDRLYYDGSFDLTFLREGETVGATGDQDGSCWVEQKTGPNTCRGMRLDVGDVLARNECGELYAYTPAPEPEYEYHLQRLEGQQWRFCGSGPCSIGTVEADFRGWSQEVPEVALRIVQREVRPWTIADHQYNGIALAAATEAAGRGR